MFISTVIVCILIIFDFGSGLIKSVKTGNFKSSKMREGLFNKLGEILAIALMYILQYGLPQIGIHIDIAFVQIITTYIAIMEVGSIIENIGELNSDLSSKLSSIFAVLKDSVHEEKEDSDEEDN